MRSLLLIITLFISLPSAYSQSKKCNAIRTGVFYTKPNPKKNQPLIKIERTEFSQFETVGDGEPLQYAITWLDDCNYLLENTLDKEKIRIVVTVVKVKKKYYSYTATMMGKHIVSGKLYRKHP
jgi:hypothetical protein